MAEWLRRWTRNPLGSPRAGSNPARDDTHHVRLLFSITVCVLTLTWHIPISHSDFAPNPPNSPEKHSSPSMWICEESCSRV
ncbi:unnamed protein product, partial [Rodentolepis nana]